MRDSDAWQQGPSSDSNNDEGGALSYSSKTRLIFLFESIQSFGEILLQRVILALILW